MNVLMICPQYWPLVGGYERAAERLSGALVARSVAVTVVTEKRQREWPLREQRNGVAIRRLRCFFRPGWHSLSAAAALAGWLLRHGRRHDLWHVHQYGPALTVAVLCGRLLRRPVILKLTNSAANGIIANIGKGRQHRLARWTHRHVDGCVAVSRETAAEAIAFGIPANRLRVIGNGVDTAEYRPASAPERAALRVALGLPERPLAVFLGRLSPEKNVEGLLAAWASAQPSLASRWTLAIVGDGPLRGALEEQATALGLGDTVVFAGFSERGRDWLRAADINVLASHDEGLSNTVLEAMASGLPSVVTAVSGMAQLIDETGGGIMVPCGDTAAFAAALVQLANDTGGREAMGRAARTACAATYDVERVADHHLAFYQDIIAAHG